MRCGLGIVLRRQLGRNRFRNQACEELPLLLVNSHVGLPARDDLFWQLRELPSREGLVKSRLLADRHQRQGRIRRMLRSLGQDGLDQLGVVGLEPRAEQAGYLGRFQASHQANLSGQRQGKKINAVQVEGTCNHQSMN
jgi:hypothetical protein